MSWLSEAWNAVSGNTARNRSLDAQHEGSQQALNFNREAYQDQIGLATPWTLAGTNALGQMQDPRFQQNFTMTDFQADPGYQFRMQEGMKAVQNSAAARGSLHSGATMKALARYSQGLADQTYNDAYNRFNADNDRNFNRLGTLAGLGHNTNSQLMNAAQNYGTQAGNIHMGYGNAQAAAHMGQYQTNMGLLGQGLQAGATIGGAMLAPAVASDERVKTNIKPVNKEDLAELRRTIKPYLFNYANDEYGKGDWVGVMAQDLEKTKLGRRLVEENGRGVKVINMKKALSLILATMAEA